MRTTLTIDQDVLSAARELASHEGRTIGEIISTWARQTLMDRAAAAQSPVGSFGFRPLAHRGVVVTNEAINAIRESEGI